MNRLFLFLLTGVLVLTGCAQVAEGEEVEVHNYWARAASKGDNSAVYLLLHNHTKQDDEMIGASSDSAEAVEVHESKIGDDGIMRMIPQASVPLPADGELEFAPGGLHIMLVGVKKDFKPGDSIEIVLHFRIHEDISLTVPVMDTAEMGGAGMDGYVAP